MEEINFPDALYENHLKEINGIKFTPREIEIIAFILSGRSIKKIASFFSISPKTIENHIHNIKEKLGCNSRESIIDFIERSGKLSYIRQYYTNWLIHAEFKGILKRLTMMNESSICSIVRWPMKEGEYNFLPYFKNHLKLAGIKVTFDTRQKLQSISSLLTEPIQGMYKIYLLPKKALNEAQNIHTQPSNIITSPSKLFILPTKTPRPNPPIVLPGCDSLDLSYCKNYYFLVFEVIKRLYAQHSIEKDILEFQQKISALSSFHPKEKLIFDPQYNRPTKKIHLTQFLKLLLEKRKYLVISILLCLAGISPLWLYPRNQPITAAPTNQPIHSPEAIKLLVRSELSIPSNSALLERSELLTQIDNQLNKYPGEIQVIALTGIGGSGKTTLARQYARSQKVTVIWEVNAETPETLLNSFENLAYALSQTEKEKKLIRGINETKKQEERTKQLFQFITDKLKSVPGWLFIFDNADNINKIWNYFLHNMEAMKRGKIIVTSRDSNIQMNSRISQAIHLRELNEDQKLELFMKIMTMDNNKRFTQAQKKEAQEFLKHLPPFPLDISTAAYYLKVTDTSYSHYLKHIKQPSDDFNEVQESILGDMSDYTKSRYQIISMSLQNLLKTNQEFCKPLLFISLLEASLIPRDLLEEITDDICLDKLVVSLKKYSLITNENHPNISNIVTYSLHRNTQAILLAYLVKVLKLEITQA